MRRSPYFLLKVSFLIMVLLIIAGTVFFYYSEHWSWVDSFYFITMTVTTVGYGDLVPSHNISKIVTALYGLVSIPMFVFAFSGVVERYTESRINRLEYKLRKVLEVEEEIDDVLEQDRGHRKPTHLIKRFLGIK